MAEVSLGAAFLGGVLIFFTPCILPLVPVYLGYMAGISANTKKSLAFTFLNALLFVLGFSLVFIALGASVGFIGFFFVDQLSLIRKIMGIFLVISGLFIIGILRIPWLYQERRLFPENKSGPLASLLLGFAFAFGWTPCIGPVLGGILTLAYSSATVLKGALLLSVFSLGLAIPFLTSSLILDRITGAFNLIKRYSRWVEVASGLLLITLGVLIFTDNLVKVNSFFNFMNFVPEGI